MQTFTGPEYLKIDIANSFGMDKLSWADRLEWFDYSEADLEKLTPIAETPALYHAGVQAWRAHQAGEPIGYMINLDATSSGLQILAALTGDDRAASLCNVTNTGNREDAYTGIYDHMVAVLGETSKISRADTKQAIMTSCYGSTAMPKQVFGDGALLDVFYRTMQEKAPAVWALNQIFLDIWDPNTTINSWVLPDNFHVHIKVMASVEQKVHFMNQPVSVYYKVNTPIENGRSLGANVTHSIDGMIVRDITRRCDYDPAWINRCRQLLAGENVPSILNNRKDRAEARAMVTQLSTHHKNTGYFSARVLDYLDPETIDLIDRIALYELLASLPEKPFKVVSIHDCFRCLPHYGNDLREQYILQLSLIARSTLLSDILSQITGRYVGVAQLNSSLWRDILDTEYALS